jgi:RND family efflux transporter MFP subunit
MLDPNDKKLRLAQLRRIGLAAALAALAVGGCGIFIRDRSQAELAHWTKDQAIPSVTLVSPQRGVEGQELTLPAEIQAYYEAPIHARVGGFLKMWYQDIGAHVKAGQLLAEIDTPDLDQQLIQAKADLASAQANAALANLTAKRWKASIVAEAVSQQTIDEKVGDAEARRAQAAAAAANVQRLNVLEGFKRIIAPFDGIVTARKTDIGALINANGESGPELFSVADTSRMRVYVRVPQAMLAALTAGMQAVLKLPQFPDRTFMAVLDTTSNAVDRDSRTTLAEFLADNRDGKLWPGTYAEAHLQLAKNPSIMHLPTSALLFRQEGLSVATLDSHDKVLLKPILVGRDLGTEVEVLSGVGIADRVIDSPPDSIVDGDPVRLDDARLSQRESASTGTPPKGPRA